MRDKSWQNIKRGIPQGKIPLYIVSPEQFLLFCGFAFVRIQRQIEIVKSKVTMISKIFNIVVVLPPLLMTHLWSLTISRARASPFSLDTASDNSLLAIYFRAVTIMFLTHLAKDYCIWLMLFGYGYLFVFWGNLVQQRQS